MGMVLCFCPVVCNQIRWMQKDEGMYGWKFTISTSSVMQRATLKLI